MTAMTGNGWNSLRLQKGYVDQKISPQPFIPTCWVENGWHFNLGWTTPLRIPSVYLWSELATEERCRVSTYKSFSPQWCSDAEMSSQLKCCCPAVPAVQWLHTPHTHQTHTPHTLQTHMCTIPLTLYYLQQNKSQTSLSGDFDSLSAAAVHLWAASKPASQPESQSASQPCRGAGRRLAAWFGLSFSLWQCEIFVSAACRQRLVRDARDLTSWK